MTWTKLHDACENRHFDDVVALAMNHPDELLRVDDHGSTPLHILCCDNPDPRAVQAVLDKCPHAATDQDFHGDTPLHVACACSHTDKHLVQLLLNSSPNAISIVNREGLMPLHMACRHAPQNEGVIGLLVEKHPYALRSHIKIGDAAPSKKKTPLLTKPIDHFFIDPSNGMATKTSSSWRYDWTSQQVRDGSYPLHMAVQAHAPVSVLEILIKEAAEILLERNKFGETPLHLALKNYESDDVVELLLQWSTPAKVARIRDKRGDLPLHVAVKNGCSVHVAKDLLEAWPESIHERNTGGKAGDAAGMTPMELALHYGKCSEAVLRLLAIADEETVP